MSNPSFACCCEGGTCDCTLRNTIFETKIPSGCCHLYDELILWCQRPGFSEEVWLDCQGTSEVHYRTTWASCEPIVALYKFYDCWYRVAYPPPGQGAEGLCDLPRACSFGGCSGAPGVGTTSCEPGGVDWPLASDPCCAGAGVGCQCGTTWLTNRMRFVLQDGDIRYPSPCMWLDDLTCYAGGANVCGLGSAYSQFLGVVYFERVWKIPDGQFSKDFCPPDARIYIPPCDNCTEDYDPNSSTAVPYWWAYAGSGVPLFLCDLQDAVAHGVISGAEYTSLLGDLISQVQPDQAILCKMKEYFTPKDWRAEQAAAWNELNAYFESGAWPSLEPCEMGLLGPFRKRCTPSCSVGALPCWRRSLMTPLHYILNPLGNEVPYPGSCSNTAAYQYWADRQWSYWRGVPGGWAWGCAGLTPDQFKAGVGRNSLDCVLGMRNQVRCDPTHIDLPCNPTASPCCGRTSGNCSGCQSAGCANFTEAFSCLGFADMVCSGFVAQPQCEGIRFTGFQYSMTNNLSQPVNPKMKCLYSAQSFLAPAKRSASWSPGCPMSCVANSPPLAMFSNWPALAPGALGEKIICRDLDNAGGVYTTADLCCGTHCYTTDANGCIWWPENEGTATTIFRSCAAGTYCPPTLTAAQTACLGYTPTCP